MRYLAVIVVMMLASCGWCEEAASGDCPRWGRTWDRNMISPAIDIPHQFNAGKRLPRSENIDPATTENVKWVVKLGSETYGNTVVANGKVLVGTNNESPRDTKLSGDRGVLLCFDEATGAFDWQLAIPKLASGRVNDWDMIGICSAPLIEGERAYLATNRCEIICLDLKGLSNGNDGTFQDEAQYLAGAGKPPVALSRTDGDILWRYDMMRELGVFPHNATSCAIMIIGDLLYTSTSNGQDWTHKNVPAPNAPTFVALNKNTGEFVAEDDAGIGTRILHGNWCSPSMGVVKDKPQIFFGGGDGWIYGIDPVPVKDAETSWLKTVWRADCTRDYRFDKTGAPIPYPGYNGPSEVIATPVFYKGLVYVATGQDPEHGEGIGILTCFDPTGSGDVTKTHKKWTFTGIKRSISTVSIANDLLLLGDFSGNIYCLDPETGTPYWTYETHSHIWGSGLAVDGKYFIGTEKGVLYCFELKREMKLLSVTKFPSAIHASPVAANGVLYVASDTHLYVIQGKAGK